MEVILLKWFVLNTDKIKREEEVDLENKIIDIYRYRANL